MNLKYNPFFYCLAEKTQQIAHLKSQKDSPIYIICQGKSDTLLAHKHYVHSFCLVKK